jgi:hypothetical protein
MHLLQTFRNKRNLSYLGLQRLHLFLIPLLPDAADRYRREPPSPDPLDNYNDSDWEEKPQQEGVYRKPDSDSSDSDSSEDPLIMTGTSFAFLANITNPRSYREAHISGQWEHWKVAMDDELSKMDKYQLFKITPRKPSMNVLKARWVYTRKIDHTTCKIAAYVAHWVAKGYAQVEGVQSHDCCASVIHKDSIQVFLSFVNTHNMECDQVNIRHEATFRNGGLQETIFMEAT